MTDKITKDQLTFEYAAFALPRDIKETWLTALRSGEYKQGYNTLYDKYEDGYCCLGVLEKAVLGDVDRKKTRSGMPLGMPRKASCEAMGVVFLEDSPPVGRCKEVHIRGFTVSCHTLPELNDYSNMTFTEIADLIEKNVEVYDRE
jgi:hypothetical protein